MEFVNNLKDPIIFDPKEIRTKENFLRPNQELFANPKPSKVLPENKRNFLITHFLEDESSEKKPLIKEGQHIKQINSRLFSERREQIRSNSNPMLFSFLTDRKRVSLQFPSDYFEMITKDYLPQNGLTSYERILFSKEIFEKTHLFQPNIENEECLNQHSNSPFYFSSSSISNE